MSLLNSLGDFAGIAEQLAQDDCAGGLAQQRQPWYNSYGDCLHYSSADEATVGDWVDEHFTILRSALDNRIIGFNIYGISKIAEEIQAENKAATKE